MCTPEAKTGLKQQFLAALGEVCTVKAAAPKVGLGVSTIFAWLNEDPEFAAAYDRVRGHEVVDTIETEMARRGIEGWDEPVFYKGEVVGAVKKYSDACLIVLAKGAAPEKYKERVEHTGEGGGPIRTVNIHVVSEQARQQLAAILEGKRVGDG